jgi:SOS-response transcriptional repressor LexA
MIADQTLAEWLNRIMDERRLTQADLAKLADVSPGQISKMCSGEIKTSPRVDDIARALKVPNPGFNTRGRPGNIPPAVTEAVRRINTAPMGGARSPASLSGYREIEVLGRAAAGKGSVILGGESGERIFCPPELIAVEGVYALQVVGESMRPMYRPGQRVVVHPYRTLVPGEGVVVQVGDEGESEWEGIIKEFVSQDESGITLKEYQPKVREFKVAAGRVRAAHLVLVAMTP